MGLVLCQRYRFVLTLKLDMDNLELEASVSQEIFITNHIISFGMCRDRDGREG